MTPSKRRRALDAADRAVEAIERASHYAWGELPTWGDITPEQRWATLKALARTRRLLDKAEYMVMRLECRRAGEGEG